MRSRRQLFTALKVIFTIVLITWVISRTGLEDIYQALTNDVKPLYLVLALGVFQIGIFLRTLRWHILLREHTGSISVWQLLYLTYSASFFNLFLPTSIGGDVVRATELHDENLTISQSSGVVLFDRLIGLMALFAICLVALPFGASQLPGTTQRWIVALCVAGLAGGIIISQGWIISPVLAWMKRRNLPLVDPLMKINQTVTTTSNRALWQAILLSLLSNIAVVVDHYIIGLAFPVHISFIYFAIFTPIVALSLLFPVIQGIGVREEMFRSLLVQVGVPDVIGVSIGLGVYAMNLMTGLLGGILYIIYTLIKRRASMEHIQHAEG